MQLFHFLQILRKIKYIFDESNSESFWIYRKIAFILPAST